MSEMSETPNRKPPQGGSGTAPPQSSEAAVALRRRLAEEIVRYVKNKVVGGEAPHASHVASMINAICGDPSAPLPAGLILVKGDRVINCRELVAVIDEVHGQRGDDNCWMDVDKIFLAAGLPAPDRRVGDKFAMARNCLRFIDKLCSGGEWKSYVELEEENSQLRDEVARLREELEAMRAGYEEALRR